MKNPQDGELSPEKLDAHFDMLDLTGADSTARRLELVKIVPQRPRTIAELLRDDFGEEGGGAPALLAPVPVTH
jgi:hypothetical protein